MNVSDAAEKPTVTPDQLAGALRRLGVVAGDALYVHSSLSSLGHMDGGADAAVGALLAAVAPGGHVAVPTHGGGGRAPDGTHLGFDRLASASRTGAITEALRRRPDAFRSGHPSHSIAAVGPRAESLVAGHEPPCSTFALGGPHGKLVRANGRIVFLGCRISANTMFHAAEAWLDLPYLPDRTLYLAGPDGPVAVATRHSPPGHRNFYGDADGGPLVRQLEAEGKVARVMLNSTRLRMLNARDVVRIVCEAEMRTPGSLLCEDAACEFCPAARAQCRDQHARIAEAAARLLADPAMTDAAAPAAMWWT